MVIFLLFLYPTASSVGNKKSMPEGLFIASQNGTLVQYTLEPKPKSITTTDKVAEDMPVELIATGQLQWTLNRYLH